MVIKTDFSATKRTTWYEYAIRFSLGGVITSAAGLNAKFYGPVIGGLFLAFPATAGAEAPPRSNPPER